SGGRGQDGPQRPRPAVGQGGDGGAGVRVVGPDGRYRAADQPALVGAVGQGRVAGPDGRAAGPQGDGPGRPAVVRQPTPKAARAAVLQVPAPTELQGGDQVVALAGERADEVGAQPPGRNRAVRHQVVPQGDGPARHVVDPTGHPLTVPPDAV